MKRRSRASVATVAAIVAAAAIALLGLQDAEAQRYKRDSLVKSLDVKQTERTQKIEPKDKSAEKKVQPEVTADEFIALQGKVGHIRDEQVKQFEILIADTDPNDPELPDLLFRLAELHAQQQRYWQFRGMEMYSALDKAKKNERPALEQKQKSYFDASKKALLNSVKAYKRIADNPKFSGFPRMDEVLFYYAYTLQGAKYTKDARAVYHRLIKDYPNSKYIPEAYLAFADYYFAENSLANAERFYDKVLEFPKSGVYNYAMYKKGWVYLNMENYQDALETFFQVSQRTKGNDKEKSLNTAAKRDFVRAYAEVGKPQLAYKAFERMDKDSAFDLLAVLGDVYLEQGKAEKAVYTFRELIGLQPKDARVCEWQYNVVRAVLTIGSNDLKVKEVQNLVKLYVAYRDNKVLPETNMQECEDNAEETTSELTKLWHNEALKTMNYDMLVYVEKLYQLYLASFPKSPEHAEMQYYYAELSWMRAEQAKDKTELWEQAAIAFTDVVKTGKLKGKLLKEAAYAAVLGWKNALNVDPSTKAPPPDEDQDKVPEALPIPEREQKMIEAFDVYINYVKDPKDEELVMMKFLKARLYWRYNQFDKALPMFEDIVQNHLDHETGEYSVNLLLDTLIRAQRYDQMIKWVDFLLPKKEFLEGKEDIAERLQNLKHTSLRKNAEQLEKVAKTSGDFSKYVECGKQYLEVFNRRPNADDADIVLYNAGVCLEEGKSISAAITIYTQLTRLFPNSPQAQKALGRLGNAFARVAYYDKAAEKLEEYAKRFGGEKDAYEALSDAVFYRKGIGDDDLAIKDTEFFIKQYGKTRVQEAASAMFSLTAIYEKLGDNEKVVSHLRRYLKTYGETGGIDRQIAAHVKMGMILWEQSCPVKGVDGACVKITRERSIVDRNKGKKKKKSNTLPTQCGPESKIKLQVLWRDYPKVKAAKKEFERAIALFGNGAALKKVPGADDAEKAGRAAAMNRFYAAAKFHLAEESYEAFLGIKFPQGLDFNPEEPGKLKKSQKRFADYLKERNAASDKALKAYKEIIDMKLPGMVSYAISSAARIGQISQNFGDSLFTAEIPEDVRTGAYAEDKVDAYCDALTTAAEPYEAISVDAFGACLKLSTSLNWFSNWSQLCERELGQIRPQEYPTAAEMRAEPNNMAAVIALESPVTELEPDKLEAKEQPAKPAEGQPAQN